MDTLKPEGTIFKKNNEKARQNTENKWRHNNEHTVLNNETHQKKSEKLMKNNDSWHI